MRRIRCCRVLAVAGASGLIWAGAAGSAPAGAVTTTGSPPPAAGAGLSEVAPAPAWVARARPLGTAPAGQQETVTVYLRQPHAAAAGQFAAAVSDPASPLYRHFLTPAQYRSRFAPPASAAAAVGGYLRSSGLQVGSVPANRLYVRASGTAAAMQRAFHTTVLRYQRNGTGASAPSSPLLLPASVAPLVAGTAGLDTSVAAPVQTGPANPAKSGTGSAAAAAAPGCSSYFLQHTAAMPAAYGRTTFPTQICGYTPAQVHSAFGTAGLLARGIDGRGVTVAVVLFYPTPTAVSDLNTFAANHGLPQLTAGQYTQYLPDSFNFGPSGGCPPLQQVTNESVGDLEAVHNMAPGAKLVYVASSDCQPQDILTTINQTVDNRLADVVTNSYALQYSAVPQAVLDAAHQAYVQAAAEGMSVVYGSGDLGDYSPLLGTPQTIWPASDPAVTAVGGTSLFVGPAGQREGELGWGTTFDPVTSAGSYALPLPGQFFLGSGGGPAAGYAEPAYQRGVVPPALAGSSDPRRVVPDVAADADPATPVLEGITVNGTYTETGGAGTSIATPLFAGLTALADQAARGPRGFLNPLLYRLHATPVFHDIKSVPAPVAMQFVLGGTTYLDTLQADTSLTAAPGYDDQTGLGSPDGALYVAALAHQPPG